MQSHHPLCPSQYQQHKNHQQWLAPTAVALACTLLTGTAFAQTDAPIDAATAAGTGQADSATTASNSLPTVTVTARKRSEKLLEVPISIQSFSQADLRASGTTDITDLSSQSGFKFTSAQGTGAQGRAGGVVTFRGLQGELNFPWENSGGVFIDGIFVSGGVSSIGMNDVARVEVLKGPQNAFFGRSTFGGAVNFITKNPSHALTGAVNATVNNHGSTDVDATIEGTLVEDLLSGRVSFGARTKTASYRATDGGDLGAESSKFVAGTLYLTPSDDFWVRLRTHVQKDEDSSAVTAYLPATGNTSCTGAVFNGIGRDRSLVQYTPGTPYFCGSVPSLKQVGTGVIDANTAIPAGAYSAFVNNSLNDPFLAKTPRLDHAGMAREIVRGSVQAGYSLPHGLELALNVGYNQADSVSIFDIERSKTQNFFALQTTLTKDLTADARLSTNSRAALRAVFGLSYFKSSFKLSQLNLTTATGATAAVRDSGNYLDLNSSVPAIYGSVEYDITKQITASLETRRQTDKIDSTTFAGVPYTNKINNWLPRVTLRYKPVESMSVYLNVARGVQPLTVNNGYINASAAGKAYMVSLFPDIGEFTPQPKLRSVELGLKQRLNNQFQYAIAFYDQTWKNRLSSSTVFNPATCGTTTGTADCPFTVTGAGATIGNDASIRGVELSLEAQLSNAWSAGAYIDFKDATWDKFDSSGQSIYGSNRALALTGTAVSFDGNELGRMPKLSASVNSTYRFKLGAWSSYLRGDLTYVGKQWESDFNFAQIDAYSRLDARLGFDKGAVSLEFFVKNLANDRSWLHVSRSPNLTLTPLTNFSQQGLMATPQEERAVGARLRYTY